jgi:type II secretory pathway pseudopilin PulG
MRIFNPKNNVGGFTYIGLLLAVAMFGVALVAVGDVWSTTLKRERERELLFAGDAFRRAIVDYFENSPGGAKQFPKSFDDLLLDRRFPTVRRHLRRVYVDPFSGKTDWGIVKGPGDTIMGVYSLSQEETLKKNKFPQGYENFEGKARHSEWRFEYAQIPAKPGETKTVNKAGQSSAARSSQGISTSSIIRPPVESGAQSQSSIPLQSVESLSQGTASTGAIPSAGQGGVEGYYQRRDLPSSRPPP